jgi:hypothetical protein
VTTLGAVALAFVGSMVLAAPAAQASTSEVAAAKASAQAVICPVRVVRLAPRWVWREDDDNFHIHNFWQEGTLLNIYQGEIREDGGVVFVKTTTKVGDTRLWVRQRDIEGTGDACHS